MKREENEKKRKKNVITKAKRVRNMVMMLLLCILMMSAATYAWFTLSNTAKIANLTMTVGEATGLQIAEDKGNTPGESDWKGTIDGGTFAGKLLPATTTNGINMLEPEYNDDGEVSGTKTATESITKTSTNTDEGYYIETSFYLRAIGAADGTTKIKLADGVGIGTNGIWSEANSYNGTYVLSKNVNAGDILPGAAVRISLQIADVASATVFEPNSDYRTNASQVANDIRENKDIVTSTVTQTMAGTCSDNVILTLNNNEATKIILRIWIEGGDLQCGNEISAKDIVTQLKFVTDNTTTPTPGP